MPKNGGDVACKSDPSRVLAAHQTGPARRAHRTSRVGVGKAHALRCQPVGLWGAKHGISDRSVENPRVFIFLGGPEADRGGSVGRGNRFLTVAAPIGPKAHGHSPTVAALSVALGNTALENVVSKNVAAGTDGLAFYGYHPPAILAFALVVGRELEPNPHLLAELQELGLSLGVVGEQTAAKK